MSLSIRQKLILLIASGLVAITIIGGIGGKTAFQIFSSVESVNTHQDITKGLSDLKSITNEATRLALDCIVDKNEGDISQERLERIKQLTAENKAACNFLAPFVKNEKWLPEVRQSISNLLQATEIDLRNLIIDLTSTKADLTTKIKNTEKSISKQSDLLLSMTDNLARYYASRNALRSVRSEIADLKFASNSFSLITLKILMDKDSGISSKNASMLKSQLDTISSNIDSLSMLAQTSEELELCSQMEAAAKKLEEEGCRILPSLISEWTTTLHNLEVKFSKIDDVLDANSSTVLQIIQNRINDTTQQATELTNESNNIFEKGIWTSVIIYLLTALVLSGLGFTIIKGITTPLERTVNYANSIANGNLDAFIDYQHKDEIGELISSLQHMVSMLKELITEADEMKQQAVEKTSLAEKALEQARLANEQAEKAKQEGITEAASRLAAVVNHVTSSANELQQIVDDTSEQLSTQNSRLTETAVSMEQMHATVFDVSQNASSTSQHTQAAKEMATHGAAAVHKVTDGVSTVQINFNMMQQGLDELNTHANGIGEIMGVITDIADQTNLLALNAAIEAARAGEAGRGFAVVADEVRKLAEKTMQATHEVGNAVTAIQSGTHNTVEGMHSTTTAVSEVTSLAKEAGDNLAEIVSVVQTSSEQVASIAAAAEEQSTASEEINKAVSDVSRVSQDVFEAMKFARNTLGTLALQANELQAIITDLQNG
ncbi:methyl-accepting chemotaxis protein [Halodesulfovibrio marinisediminis]|uniref:HAMP domain-containing protein n=1 Tax=Halodesulfovibrio marinisediminis DSM 17456 TaxID=1121457 RepID=A0A1N6ITN8_9BACT|nr:methyl-accepting chemotaxis protein [Halodesulfovibrio marinisediminis]SIO35363.1 HAMP domain-containing protein [Halodesulfovibrio marinisediminis DSM 17456]